MPSPKRHPQLLRKGQSQGELEDRPSLCPKLQYILPLAGFVGQFDHLVLGNLCQIVEFFASEGLGNLDKSLDSARRLSSIMGLGLKDDISRRNPSSIGRTSS